MRIEDVMVGLLVRNPFYGYVAATVQPVPSEAVERTRMTTLPSMKLLYNPSWFDSLEDVEQEAAVIHELLHIMLMHPFRQSSRQPALWAIACDMAVNEYIHHEHLLADAITVPKIAHEYGVRLEKKRSAEYYYDKLLEDSTAFAFATTDDHASVILESDQDMKSDLLSDEGASEADVKALKAQLSQLMNESAGDGDTPPDLEGLINDVYQEFKVNWRTVLKRFLSGRGKIVVRKSYKRKSRRFDNLPGTKRSVGVRALLAIDESGSISDGLLDKFYHELQSINKITGADIYVTRFDTECTTPVPIAQYVKDKNRVKRGGTDFNPVFETADKMRFPLLIIFTDGDGDAPNTANQNTLWVIAGKGQNPTNFGHTLVFED